MQVASIAFESDDPRCICPNCGGRLHRRARKGFFQSGVFPRFGYYPWECFSCSEKRMLRARGRRPGFHQPSGNRRAESGKVPLVPLQEQFNAKQPSLSLKAEAAVPVVNESSPDPVAQNQSLPIGESALPTVLATEEPAILKEKFPAVLMDETQHQPEDASLQIRKIESSEYPASGPLFSRKAEALRAPRREYLSLRSRDSSRATNKLPPVSEAAIRRAIFEEDSSPETAHSPDAPPACA